MVQILSQFILKKIIYIYIYKDKPLLFILDSLILHTIIIVVYFIMELLYLNVIERDIFFYYHNLLLLINFFILVLYVEIIKINSCYKFLSYCLPILLLFMSFINVLYNYLPILYTISLYILTIVIVLLFSGLYTLFLLRSNTKIFNPRTSIKESIKHIYKFLKLIWNHPRILIIFIFIFVLCFSMRFFILKDVPFTVNLLHFNLFYLIIFSLWMPSLFMSEALIRYYSNDNFNHIYFKQKFNFSNLKILFLFTTASFSFKCVILWVLELDPFIICKFKPKIIDTYFDKYVKLINKYKIYQPHGVRLSGMRPGWTYCVLGIPLLFVSNADDSHEWNTARYKDLDFLLENGYHRDELSNILLPPDIEELDHGLETRLGEQLRKIANKKLDKIYYEIDEGKVLNHLEMSRLCNKILNKQKDDLLSVKNFPQEHIPGPLDDEILKNEIKCMNENSKKEQYVYGFMNTLLTQLLPFKDGFIISPQGPLDKWTCSGSPAPDFVIKRHGTVVGIAESKALDSKNYTLRDLYEQAIHYAMRDLNETTIGHFIIINKGPYISVGYHYNNLHSINEWYKKGVYYDGYIGLQVDKDLSVKPVPQRNVFEPQHKLYKVGYSNEHDISIYKLFEFIKSYTKQGKIMGPELLDFGDEYIVLPDGRIMSKNITADFYISFFPPVGASVEEIEKLVPKSWVDLLQLNTKSWQLQSSTDRLTVKPSTDRLTVKPSTDRLTVKPSLKSLQSSESLDRPAKRQCIAFHEKGHMVQKQKVRFIASENGYIRDMKPEDS